MITSTGSAGMREDIIRTKMAEIEESIKLVEEHLPEDVNEFVALGLVKEDLELGIPASEEDIIENLVKNKILSPDMGRIVKEMKGFRNFLVHTYGKVDDSIAFENIKYGIEDFSKFIDEIKSFLDRYHSEKKA